MPKSNRVVVGTLAALAFAWMVAVPVSFSAEKTVTGYVRDPSCLLRMGAKGEKHKKCAVDCAKAGINYILEEDGTGKLYVILPEKDKTNPSEKLHSFAELKVKVTGEEHTQGGLTAIVAKKVESAK